MTNVKVTIKKKMTIDNFPPLTNDLMLRVLKGERVERVPVWIMRQAGRFLPGI